MARASSSPPPVVERCWILLGRRQGRVWCARRVRPARGTRTRVGFDGLWVLRREECHGDVAGFYHTHPDGPAYPSRRDVRTLRAWCSAFGKPLVCLIATPRGLTGFRFDGPASAGEPLAVVEAFPGGVIVGVDADGG